MKTEAYSEAFDEDEAFGVVGSAWWVVAQGLEIRDEDMRGRQEVLSDLDVAQRKACALLDRRSWHDQAKCMIKTKE
jgi:hypothetical protein